MLVSIYHIVQCHTCINVKRTTQQIKYKWDQLVHTIKRLNASTWMTWKYTHKWRHSAMRTLYSLDELTRWPGNWQLKLSTNKYVVVLSMHRLSTLPARDYTLAGPFVPNCMRFSQTTWRYCRLGFKVQSTAAVSPEQHRVLVVSTSVLCRKTKNVLWEPTLHMYIWECFASVVDALRTNLKQSKECLRNVYIECLIWITQPYLSSKLTLLTAWKSVDYMRINCCFSIQYSTRISRYYFVWFFSLNNDNISVKRVH